MKHGLIQPNGRMHELHMYQIEGLCKAMMETAIKDEKYAAVYEEKYKGKYTYFSEALEFCLHELGWMLYDPFVTGKDEDHVNVLFIFNFFHICTNFFSPFTRSRIFWIHLFRCY